jgi:Ni/Fe-hydrogenase subunit HybB-like protein
MFIGCPSKRGNEVKTNGVMVLLALMGVGLAFVAARFLFGIGKAANLNNQFPWGIWIGIDVASGVALAAGGFTNGAIAYVFNRDQYHAVLRPTLLTAMLGYTFVVWISVARAATKPAIT